MCLVVGKSQLYCDPGMTDSGHITRGKIACEKFLGPTSNYKPKAWVMKVYALLMLLRKRESLKLVE